MKRMMMTSLVVLLSVSYIEAKPGETYTLTGDEKGVSGIIKADMKQFPELYKGESLSSYILKFKHENKIGQRKLSPSDQLRFPETLASIKAKKESEAKAEKNIKKYHLQSTSDLISLTVTASYPTALKDTVEFKLVLKNESEKPLRLYKPRFFLGEYILLISPTGEVMEARRLSVTFKMERRSPEEAYILVAPGEAYSFSFKGELTTFPNSPSEELRKSLWLKCKRFFVHKLSHEGSFQVYGQYSYRLPNDPPYDNIWTGRVVSEPINVTIESPVKTAN